MSDITLVQHYRPKLPRNKYGITNTIGINSLGIIGSSTIPLNGSNGLSVFITYNDNELDTPPAKPTGSGNTDGWHTTPTIDSKWMSQKTARSIDEGDWEEPMPIRGADGEAGQDAVVYSLKFNSSAFLVTNTNDVLSIQPSYLTITPMKQVGSNEPVPMTDSECSVLYGFNTTTPNNRYTSFGSPIYILHTYKYITVHLVVNNNVVKVETIPVIKDGVDGVQGLQGVKGAAVRGPVDFSMVTSNRRFCNGQPNDSYPEDALWIDVVIYNDKTYYCTTSFNYTASTSWSSCSSNFTESTDFNFVATNLLLANNAKINFASNNELYLLDDDGNVTAGASGGDGISFWAGSHAPATANFAVTYDGEMTAKKGTFGNLHIGETTWGETVIMGNHTNDFGTECTIDLTPEIIQMHAVEGNHYSSIKIAPNADRDKYDVDGTITIEEHSDSITSISTNGIIQASNFKTTDGFVVTNSFTNLQIVFMTSTQSLFTKVSNKWYFNGLDTGVSSSTYPNIRYYNGWWQVYGSSTSSNVQLNVAHTTVSKASYPTTIFIEI